MTAADMSLVRHLDLPLLASDPRVTVVQDLEVDRLESCEQCVVRSYQESWPEDREIPVGRMRVTYHFRPGAPEHTCDLCGPDCADVELSDVLDLHGCVGVRLHVSPPSRFVLPSDPHGPARTPLDLEGDPIWQRIDGLRRFVKTAPTGTADPVAQDAVEAFRAKCLAAVESVAVDRIEQLGRAAS